MDWVRGTNALKKPEGKLVRGSLLPQQKPKTHLHPREPVSTNMKIDLNIATLYITQEVVFTIEIHIFSR